jgi:uncharacterized membrane protein
MIDKKIFIFFSVLIIGCLIFSSVLSSLMSTPVVDKEVKYSTGVNNNHSVSNVSKINNSNNNNNNTLVEEPKIIKVTLINTHKKDIECTGYYNGKEKSESIYINSKSSKTIYIKIYHQNDVTLGFELVNSKAQNKDDYCAVIFSDDVDGREIKI